MKKLIRLCTLILFILSACSPVKKVLTTPRYFKEVADSVVKRGYCINDTVVYYDTAIEERVFTDSVFITDSSFSRSLAAIVYFDTVFSNGTKVVIHKGKISVSCPGLERQKTITYKKDVVVRDKKLENILKEEIALYSDQNDSLTTIVEQREIQISKLQLDIRYAQIKFYALIILLFGLTIYKVIRAFRV